MFKLNFIALTLACTFSSIFCAAENEQMVVRSTRGDQECQRPLKLKDFVGEWTYAVDSLGGLGGAPAVGSSFTIDGQVTFDKDGIGTVNYASGALYSGVPGTFVTFNFTSGTFEITITDPVHGVGTMVFTSPEETISVDFVVTRDKRTGKVIEMHGHETSFTPTTDTLVTYSFFRQYQ